MSSPERVDPFNLQHFADAQAPVYAEVLKELKAGRKQTHWMWFIFPQLTGLGHSAMARTYAVGSLAEARTYLDHDLLGGRLRQCTELVDTLTGRSITAIFAPPDDMKFHSCMTLFSRAAADPAPFDQALKRYFSDAADQATLALIPD